MADERVDIADRWIAANTRAVWHALIEPAERERWLPPTGMRCRIDGWEPTLGARYRTVMTYDDPAAPGKTAPAEDVIDATITRLAPLQWLAEDIEFATDDPAFQGTMHIQWELLPAAGETYVRITATDVPPGITPDDHAAGMSSSLEHLARHVEGAPAH